MLFVLRYSRFLVQLPYRRIHGSGTVGLQTGTVAHEIHIIFDLRVMIIIDGSMRGRAIFSFVMILFLLIAFSFFLAVFCGCWRAVLVNEYTLSRPCFPPSGSLSVPSN